MTVPLHLGALHPVEQALTLLLAFGPFVVLGIVVLVRRRADARLDQADQADQPDPTEQAAGPARPAEDGQRER